MDEGEGDTPWSSRRSSTAPAAATSRRLAASATSRLFRFASGEDWPRADDALLLLLLLLLRDEESEERALRARSGDAEAADSVLELKLSSPGDAGTAA